MKMLMITKGVASEYFHTHRDFIDFFPQIALTALTYETCLFDYHFISYLVLCICFIF